MPRLYSTSRNGSISGSLLAVSDLHTAIGENQRHIDDIRPECTSDWLLVAGDVAELTSDIERTLRALASRFETVVWAPGNHELWTVPSDPVPYPEQP